MRAGWFSKKFHSLHQQVPVGPRVELTNLSNANNSDYDNTGKVMVFDVIGDSFNTNTPSALTFPDYLDTGNNVMLGLVPLTRTDFDAPVHVTGRESLTSGRRMSDCCAGESDD